MVTLTKRPTYGHTTESAHQILFGDHQPEAVTRFNYNHDTTAFDELITQKYQEIEAASATKTILPVEETISFIKPTPIESPFGSYYNDKNPVPQELYGVNSYTFAQPAEEVCAVTQIDNLVSNQTQAEVETIHRTTPMQNATYQPVLKLNAKGFIAVASFVAVLALTVTLIIINAVSISASAGRIEALTTATNSLTQTAQATQAEHAQVWASQSTFVQDSINAAAGGSVFFDDLELVHLGPARGLPQMPTFTPPPNPDHSTNWFNNLSNWLSNIFTR